jgi:hypothetical protein
MEFILKKDTCRKFLNNYHEEIYPILLPKIIEIGILTLKLSFDKVLFSPDELNEIIDSLNKQYSLQKKTSNKKLTLKKLTYNNLTLDKEDNLFNRTTFTNSNNITEGNYLNTLDSSNFYDSNYFIPTTKSYRNEQLYNKRLENPMFNTLNKKIYPFWWWNQSETEYLKYKNQTISFNKEQNAYKNFNKNKNEINKKNIRKKNYFALNKKPNRTNYKISYDKNLNVINIETGQKKIKIINNK